MILASTLLLVASSQIGGEWARGRSYDPYPPGGGPSAPRHGHAVTAGGDLDGDGSPTDVAVSDPYAGNAGEGRVVGYSGAGTWVVFGEDPGDRFGWSLDGMFDVDGDLDDEVLIGAPFHVAPNSSHTGKVYLVEGRNGAIQRSRDSYNAPSGNGTYVAFGRAVAFAGDVQGNGGGSDIAIADPEFSQPGFPPGRVLVYDGNFNLLYVVDGNGWSDFGAALEGAGDVNFNGNHELYVGVPDGNHVLTYTYPGTLVRTLYPPSSAWSRRFGEAIRNVGDLDGDSVDDVLIGDPLGGSFGSGEAFLFSGRTGTVLWGAEGGPLDGHFGSALDLAGDVDGDGTPDVLIGSPEASHHGMVAAGSVYILRGTTGEIIGRAEDNAAGGELGFSVAGMRTDANNDGLDDFVVGIPGRPDAQGSQQYPLYMDALGSSLSSASGGTIRFALRFGSDLRFAPYRLLVSFSGIGPTRIGEVPVPLGYDQQLVNSYLGLLPPFASGFVGFLDAHGEARPVLTITGAPVSLIGATIRFAAIAGYPWGPWEFGSRAHSVQIVP